MLGRGIMTRVRALDADGPLTVKLTGNGVPVLVIASVYWESQSLNCIGDANVRGPGP